MSKLIIVDPGHGGGDPGAAGNGLKEKAITWKLANKFVAALAPYDVDCRIVQPSTDNPDSAGRDELVIPPAVANALKADFYLSIHVNAGGGRGFESFVHPDKAGTAADKIRGVVHFAAMEYLRRFGVVDRGVKYENFYVLRMAKCPAVLVECLFIDNGAEAGLLADDEFLDGLANELAFGVAFGMGLERKGV